MGKQIMSSSVIELINIKDKYNLSDEDLEELLQIVEEALFRAKRREKEKEDK